MSTKLDALVQVTLKEGDDRRRRTFTTVDQTIVENVWHYLELATNTSTQVSLGGVGVNNKRKWLYVETDKAIRVAFVSVVGAVNVLTTSVNLAHRLVAGGCYSAWLTNTTHLWVRNPSTTDAATVQVVVAARTTV